MTSLADLEARVAALEADRADYRAVLAATGALRQRVDGMDERFDSIDARFERVDERFDGIDARFERVDERFDGIDARFERMDQRFDGMDERFDGLAIQTNANRESINALGEKLAGFQAETRTRFDAVEKRIDREVGGLRQEMTGRFRSVDEQLAEIKDIIVDRFRGRGQ